MIRESKFTVENLIKYLDHLKHKEYLTHGSYYNSNDRATTKLLTDSKVSVSDADKSSISYFKGNQIVPYFMILNLKEDGHPDEMKQSLRINIGINKEGFFEMEPLYVAELVMGMDDAMLKLRLASSEVIRKYAKDIYKLLTEGSTKLLTFRPKDVDWFEIRFPEVGNGDTIPLNASMLH